MTSLQHTHKKSAKCNPALPGVLSKCAPKHPRPFVKQRQPHIPIKKDTVGENESEVTELLGRDSSKMSEADRKTIQHYSAQQELKELKDTYDEAMQLQLNPLYAAVKGGLFSKSEEVVEHSDMHKYARLANASYTYEKSSHTDKSNLRRTREVHNELNDSQYKHIKDLKGFRIDKSLSTTDDVVLHNRATGESVVSYRGTVPTNLGDWKTNLRIAHDGAEGTTRYKNAEKVYLSAVKRYGKENMSVLGHSQGGGISHYIGQKYDVTSHSYNPAISNKMVLDNEAGMFKGNINKAHIYRANWDAVSVLSKYDAIKNNSEFHQPPTIPNVDSHPVNDLHGLGENFAPKINEDLGNGFVKVTRNTKLTSFVKGAHGMLAAAGAAMGVYEVTDDIITDTREHETENIATDVTNTVSKFTGGSLAFGEAVATGGLSFVGQYYFEKVADEVTNYVENKPQQPKNELPHYNEFSWLTDFFK